MPIFNPVDSSVSYTQTDLPTGGTISSSGFYTNAGAVATQIFIFANTPGISVYIRRTASQIIEIAPPAGKQIWWSGSLMNVDEKLLLNVDGDIVHCLVNDDVHITSEFGAITEETP